MVVDGNPPELVSKILAKEITLSIERNEIGLSIFKAIGDVHRHGHDRYIDRSGTDDVKHE